MTEVHEIEAAQEDGKTTERPVYILYNLAIRLVERSICKAENV